jgi:hypothetical protein
VHVYSTACWVWAHGWHMMWWRWGTFGGGVRHSCPRAPCPVWHAHPDLCVAPLSKAPCLAPHPGLAPSVALRLTGSDLQCRKAWLTALVCSPAARHRCAPGPPFLASGTRQRQAPLPPGPWCLGAVPGATAVKEGIQAVLGYGQLSGVAVCAPHRMVLSGLASSLGVWGSSRRALGPSGTFAAEANEPCAWRPQSLATRSSLMGGTHTAPSRNGWADPFWPAAVLAPGAAEGGHHSAGHLLAGSFYGRAACLASADVDSPAGPTAPRRQRFLLALTCLRIQLLKRIVVSTSLSELS